MKAAGLSSSADVKQCCANLYESDFAKLLLGESFHPGGLKLTEMERDYTRKMIGLGQKQ